jgi:integrase/recombinase XerD
MKDNEKFAYHVSYYLGRYLSEIAGFSENTIISYCTAFELLFQFMETQKCLAVESLTLSDLTSDNILGFLSWLEKDHCNKASTRNCRLASIHAFCRYLLKTEPKMMFNLEQILAIPLKKTAHSSPEYLTLEAMRRILALPDLNIKTGRRDSVLLATLYNSGCRVQELCNLKVGDLRLTSPAILRITGKGNKTRNVPIMEALARTLRLYLHENTLDLPEKNRVPLFQNRSGEKFTRKGISYILDKYTSKARQVDPPLFPSRISPHSFRHSVSMHMLQAGVNIYHIRDFLGHVDVKTTEI